MWLNKSEDRGGLGQNTVAEYKVTDGHRIHYLETPSKGNDLEEGRQDEEETN